MVTAMPDVNPIERVRLKLGLSIPEMLEVMETKPGRKNTLFTRDNVDPIFVSRARVLEAAYDRWADESMARIDAMERIEPGLDLQAVDVSRFFGISEFHLSQLRVRGLIEARLVPPNRYVYSYAGARKLLALNSTYLSDTTQRVRVRGPLAKSFLTWLSRREVSSEKSA